MTMHGQNHIKFRWDLPPSFSALVTIYIPGNTRWQEFGSHIMNLHRKESLPFYKDFCLQQISQYPRSLLNCEEGVLKNIMDPTGRCFSPWRLEVILELKVCHSGTLSSRRTHLKIPGVLLNLMKCFRFESQNNNPI